MTPEERERERERRSPCSFVALASARGPKMNPYLKTVGNEKGMRRDRPLNGSDRLDHLIPFYYMLPVFARRL